MRSRSGYSLQHTFSIASRSPGLTKATDLPRPLDTAYRTTEDCTVATTLFVLAGPRKGSIGFTVAPRMVVSSWPNGGLITTRTNARKSKVTRAQQRPRVVAMATQAQ